MTLLYFWMLAAGAGCLFGGLAALGRSLQRQSPPRLSGASPARGFALGFALTLATQSSSAVSVLLLGLARAGQLSAESALPALLGSNVGTTLTPWLLALGGRLPFVFSLRFWAPALGLAGGLLCLRAATRARGTALLAAGVVLAGLVLLTQGLAGLQNGPLYARVLNLLRQPWAGFAATAALTAAVQSSAGVLGVLQALAQSGGVTVGMALPVVLGANVGTCSTALLAAVGGGAAGRRVARCHLRFNLLGAAATAMLCAALPGALWRQPAGPLTVAALHTGFNLFAALLLWPLRRWWLPGAKKPAVWGGPTRTPGRSSR